MTNILGTNVAAPVVPFTSEDKYATHDSIYGKGGWREVDTLLDLANISSSRKREGMAVFVIENKTLYTLQNNEWIKFQAEAKSSTYEFEQVSASSRWEIKHNLGKHPSVTIVDSAGTEVIGDVQYIDNNNIIIEFSGSFTGKAYLN